VQGSQTSAMGRQTLRQGSQNSPKRQFMSTVQLDAPATGVRSHRPEQPLHTSPAEQSAASPHSPRLTQKPPSPQRCAAMQSSSATRLWRHRPASTSHFSPVPQWSVSAPAVGALLRSLFALFVALWSLLALLALFAPPLFVPAGPSSSLPP